MLSQEVGLRHNREKSDYVMCKLRRTIATLNATFLNILYISVLLVPLFTISFLRLRFVS